MPLIRTRCVMSRPGALLVRELDRGAPFRAAEVRGRVVVDGAGLVPSRARPHLLRLASRPEGQRRGLPLRAGPDAAAHRL